MSTSGCAPCATSRWPAATVGHCRYVVSAERAELALQHYLLLPLTRHGHQALLPRVLELRANFSAYDACYVALAERLRAGS